MIVLWWMLVCYLIALPFLLVGIGENLLAFSFYVNGVVMAYMARISIVRNTAGPAFATVNVFLILFFYVAPIYQIVEYPGYLINNYNAPDSQMLLANIIVFIFSVAYIAVYMWRDAAKHVPVIKVTDAEIGGRFPILVGLAGLAALWAVWLMLSGSLDADDDTISAGLNIGITIRHKVAFVIPFAAAGFYLSRKWAPRSLLMMALLVVFLLCTKNILLDRRNSLGPVYLSLISLFLWRGDIKSRQVFTLVGPALIFVFPLLSIFINHPTGEWAGLLNFENITKEIRGHFVDMHYDAWANLVAAIQYVQTEGLQIGRQLLGSLLFWLPRTMWADKPVSSGQLLGDYLVLNSGLWFTNISFSFPAEGYVDFGIPGVAIYAILMALYSARLDYFVNHGSVVERTSAIYFSFYLMFVMRGSFLPAFAFGVGALIAINVIPIAIARIGGRRRATPALPAPVVPYPLGTR